MEKEKKEYTNCYIAFLDILGFKNMVLPHTGNTKSCDEINDIYTYEIKHFQDFMNGNPLDYMDMGKIQMRVMSDSVCFCVDSSIDNSLAGLLDACLIFQTTLVFREPPVLLRGAIVRGDIFVDDDVMFGPGFVKAYQMEQNNAKYPRIIFTKDILDETAGSIDEKAKHLLSSFIFCDFDHFFALDYFRLMCEFKDRNEYTDAINHIEKILSTTIDNSVREKYLYLKNHLHEDASQEVKSHA